MPKSQAENLTILLIFSVAIFAIILAKNNNDCFAILVVALVIGYIA